MGGYIKKFNKRRRNTITVIIFLAVIIFSLFFFSDSIINTSLKIVKPFQSIILNVTNSVFDWAFSIIKKGDLKREVDLLQSEKKILTEEIIRLRGVKEENEKLRQALGLGMDKDFELVMAKVLGRNILEDVVIIDRGVKDGISEGMPVITEKRVVVGTVSKVFNDFSQITLITDQSSAFEVEIQGKDTIGLMEGLGNLNLKLRLIPRDKEITEGDALITAPLSEVFPSGLFVGLIRSIHKKDAESFQEAEVAPFFNIRRLKNLFVITNQKVHETD